MPVYHALLEHGDFEHVLACNAGHVKNVPGRKTDPMRTGWCTLLECGLLAGSFIPPADIKAARDVVRYRTNRAAGLARAARRRGTDPVPGPARAWAALARGVVARPVIWGGLAVVALLALTTPALGLRLGRPPIDAPYNLPVVKTMTEIELAFPQARRRPAQVVVTGSDVSGPRVPAAVGASGRGCRCRGWGASPGRPPAARRARRAGRSPRAGRRSSQAGSCRSGRGRRRAGRTARTRCRSGCIPPGARRPRWRARGTRSARRRPGRSRGPRRAARRRRC